MNKPEGRQLLSVIAIGLLCLSACRDRRRVWAAETANEIEHVKDRTVPPDGSLLSASKLTRSESSVRETWQIQTDKEPASYFQWLKDQFGSDYHVTSETDSMIAFVKQSAGDTYSVEIQTKKSIGTAGKIYEGTFVASPD